MADKKKKAPLKIQLNKVRLSFPHLAEPHAFSDDQEPKYSAVFLISKDDVENVDKIKKAVHAAKVRKFGADKNEWPKMKYPTPLKDGDEHSDIDGYAGHYSIAASTKDAPLLIDGKRDELSASKFYAGCYVNAIITIAAYEYGNNGKIISRGVAAYLGGVQLNNKDKGEAFGNVTSKDDFAECDDGMDDDSSDSYDDEDDAPPAKAPKKKAKPSIDEDEDEEDFDDSDEE